MQASPPDITVSIVSYNTRDLLRTCLLALRAVATEAKLQVIVADNESSDGSIAMVEAEFPEVEAFATGGNLGYGKANNLAFERAHGRYFFALNSDTEVQPGALRALLEFMDSHPEAGGACAQLIYPDGRLQTTVGRDPDIAGISLEQLYLDKLWGRLRPAAAAEPLEEVEPREVEQIAGACQFMRSDAYRQVGGFDPVYFMYNEDVDLNIQVRKAGWKLYLVPEARIVHHLGASSRAWRTRARMVAALNRSRHYYFSRHGGAGQGAFLKLLFCFGALIRLVGWSFIALARPTSLEKVKLFRHVLREAFALPNRP